MTSRKLSDSDKRDILKLYRQPGETTLTLASRYGVSSSTISRILKSSFSEQEYETLIQDKRAGRSQSSIPDEEPVESDLPVASYHQPLDEASSPNRRLRKRSSATGLEPETEIPAAENTKRQGLDVSVDGEDSNEDTVDDRYQASASALHEMLGEELLDEEDLDDEDDDLEADDDDDHEDRDEDEDDYDDAPLLRRRQVGAKTVVEVLPLSEADLAKPCYLVVDRGAELITRPLKDFGDLGKIPNEEFLERTLPIFDNHRVARRFSNRHQRVIKVPDGTVLQKTSSYLQAKGITRLLIDGQVYSL